MGFIDPFNGREDIKQKIIRCVGQPKHRFSEDALRMLRAVRFAAVTGFSIDSEILNAISELKKTLANISPERVKDELGKLICGSYPQALEILDSTGLLPYVLQGHKYSGNIKAEQLKQCRPKESMRLALFLNGTECESILQDLRYDNKTIKETLLYINLLAAPYPKNKYEIKKILRRTQPKHFENYLQLKEITDPNFNSESIRADFLSILENNECFTLKNLAINGRDLAEIGIPPGEGMGEILEILLDEVMLNPNLNKRGELILIVKKNLTKQPSIGFTIEHNR